MTVNSRTRPPQASPDASVNPSDRLQALSEGIEVSRRVVSQAVVLIVALTLGVLVLSKAGDSESRSGEVALEAGTVDDAQISASPVAQADPARGTDSSAATAPEVAGVTLSEAPSEATWSSDADRLALQALTARSGLQPSSGTTPTTSAPAETTTSTTEAPQTTTTAAPTTAAPPSTASTSQPTTDPGSSTDPSTTDPAEATSTSEGTESTEPAAETTTTAAPTTDPAKADWVDSGNGVLLPPILLKIRYCESRGNYQAANKYSSARGAYQFLTGSWADYGHASRYGVSQAHLASNVQQDEAALITWERDGTRPWNASRHCWG